MSKRTICIVTAARSEYSASKWVMQEILKDPDLNLQVIVTGAHLEHEYGDTIDELVADNIPISYCVKIDCTNSSTDRTARSLGLCASGMVDAFSALRPDIIVVFGDRYELLPICSVALLMQIPVAHVSGGDITEGAIDDSIRHAVTKLSDIHFPGTETSASVIRQLGEAEERIYVVGEPGLDGVNRHATMTRDALAQDLEMDVDKRWILFTYHPETLSKGDDIKTLENVFSVLDEQDNIQVMMTYPNADPGSQEIIIYLKGMHAANPHRYKLSKNLGQFRFISFLKAAWCMLGNSSSSLFEAPSAKLPAILINGRQKGRILPGNIVTATGDVPSLRAAFQRIQHPDFLEKLSTLVNPYGDGNTSIRIVQALKQIDTRYLKHKKFVITN